MAAVTNYRIDFTPQYTNHYWRVELVAWLFKNGDPGLQGEELEEIAIASNDVVKAELSLALTCPQVEEIRRGRSIARTWSRLEGIFEYYGPATEAPLFRQVAHQFLDGRPEMKETLRTFLEEVKEDEDEDPSSPSNLTILRNLITNPASFRLRRKITAMLDPLGLLCGVEQLCGCNPYVPPDEIPESHPSMMDCLYCKYDVSNARAQRGSDRWEGDASTRDRGAGHRPGRTHYGNQFPADDRGKPYMKTRLLSIYKLTSNEHHIIFKKDEATVVSNTGDVKLRATRAGAKFVKMEVDGVKTQPPDYADFATWHRRLGHIDFRDLYCGYRQFAFRGLKIIKSSKKETPTCQICQTIKLPGLPLRPVPHVQTQVLEIIHADFCGPIHGQTKDSAIFFITFTDDASGWISMYFIRHCTEILKYFKEYVTQAESQFQRKIRKLQSNDGLGHNFDDYLKSKDIERLKVPTDTQHIRALLESAKCMLMQSGLDESFFCEALNTACFIRNRSSSIRLDGITPYQKWYGRLPSLRHMHEFGARVTCTARTDPSKGKPEIKEGQYLGFTKKHKAYRIWVPDYQQIVLSDEVDFLDYVNAKDENRAKAERHRGTAEGPGTSRGSDEARSSGQDARPVIPKCKKTTAKFSRYDAKSPDYGFSRGPPKYDKDIHDYIKGKCGQYDEETSDEDSDSDPDGGDSIYEEEELDILGKGNDSDEDIERRIVTVKPVTDSTRKPPTTAAGAGSAATARNAQGAPGLEGTRTPSIRIRPTRPRLN